MLITLEKVAKKNNLKVILNEESFTIEEQDKIALIGVNGCGKSTLMKILAQQENIDSGKILRKKDLKIAYLSQDDVFEEGKSALHQVLSVDKEVQEFEAKSILTKLGIEDVNVDVSLLSGGLRKRVSLAKALLKPCDLMLLDEPTNHLDSNMVEWLEKYLIKSNKAIFMVTHDRYFMERVCHKMVELQQGHLSIYEANYSNYLVMKQEREQQALAAQHKRKQILKKELEWMRAGVQARGTKSKDRIDRFYALSKVEDVVVEGNVKIDTLSSRLGKKVMIAHNISKGYDGRLLFKDFSYNLQRSDRIGILGPNGCGKTTLLKVLAKVIPSDSGSMEYGETLKLGYFKQGIEDMDPAMRVIDYIKEVSNEVQTLEGSFSASVMLERFLFDSKAQYMPIGRLSGGEQRRLYLLRVLMQAPNVLFLDEPTNDLDITTLQILEDYLDDFPGAIITVSHDRYFLDRICDKLFVFENSHIKEILGGYSAYLEMNNVSDKVKEVKEVKRFQVEKMSSKEKKELEMMDEVIENLSLEIEALETKMNEESDYQIIASLSEQHLALQEQLEKTMLRWEELENKKEAIKQAMNQ